MATAIATVKRTTAQLRPGMVVWTQGMRLLITGEQRSSYDSRVRRIIHMEARVLNPDEVGGLVALMDDPKWRVQGTVGREWEVEQETI